MVVVQAMYVFPLALYIRNGWSMKLKCLAWLYRLLVEVSSTGYLTRSISSTSTRKHLR